MGLRAAGYAALAVLVALPAYAADPFRDQPGVLTPEELKAAAAAMESTLGATAKLPLTASGRRAGGALMYAVFAAPPEGEPGVASTRLRLFCTASQAAWTCEQQTLHEITLPGTKPQAFAYTVYYDPVPRPQALPHTGKGSSQDPTLPRKIVGYFARCFGEQYQALTGKPYAGGVPILADVTKTDQTSVEVAVGQGDKFDERYGLKVAAPDSNTTACDFTLQGGQIQGVTFNATGRRAEPTSPLPSYGPPVSEFRRTMDKLADFCIGLNLIAGLLALLVPLIEVFAMGRRAAGISSAILTGITLVSAVAAGVSMKAAAITDTGNSMLVVLPLTFFAILTCVVWVLVWLIPDALRSRARRD